MEYIPELKCIIAFSSLKKIIATVAAMADIAVILASLKSLPSRTIPHQISSATIKADVNQNAPPPTASGRKARKSIAPPFAIILGTNKNDATSTDGR